MLFTPELIVLAPIDASGMAGLLLTASIKAGTLLAAAGVLAVLLKKSPACTRHAVWGIGLSAALALPALSLLLPPVKIPLWRAAAGSPARQGKPAAGGASAVQPIQGTAPAESYTWPPIKLGGPARAEVATEPTFEQSPSDQPIVDRSSARAPIATQTLWAIVILLVWLAGFLISLSRWIAGIFGASIVAWRSQEVDSRECTADLGLLSGSLGLARRVRLLEYDRGSMPMTCGIIRPTIILPISHIDWPAERRKVVLLHELSHVKRWDCLAQAIGQIVCAFYWPNPLMWLAARRLRLESENACDDAVIDSGTKASAYAWHLLEIAREFGVINCSPRGALTIARPSQLESRLRSILDPARQNRHGGEKLRQALTSVSLISITLVLAALGPHPRQAAALTNTGQVADGETRPPLKARPGPAVHDSSPEGNPVQAASSAVRPQPASNGLPSPQPTAQPPSEAGGPDQNQASVPDARPQVPEQRFEEKESFVISQRIADRYIRSESIDSASEQEADQKESGQRSTLDAAVEALAAALKDKDPGVRANAIWALAMHGGKASQDALIAALKDEDPQVRGQAAWGLGLHGDTKAVEPLISALKDPQAQVRSQAAWALGMKGDNRAVGPLMSALKDEQPQVRSQAAWALGMRGSGQAVDALKALLNDSSNQVRRQATWALGMLLMRSSGDGDETEEEQDGESRVGSRHPHLNLHKHVNLARPLGRVN